MGLQQELRQSAGAAAKFNNPSGFVETSLIDQLGQGRIFVEGLLILAAAKTIIKAARFLVG